MNPTSDLKYCLLILCYCLSPQLIAENPFFNCLPTKSPVLYNEIIERTICTGDCTVFEGQTYCEAGAFPLGNERTLKVNVLPSVQQVNFTICEGNTYPGQDWSTPGRYNYQTQMGECEVTVWVDLKVAQPKETYINQQIEYGTCYDFGPNTLCQSGEYEMHYLTTESCDSTVYINLTVDDLIIDTLPAVRMCQGESYSPNGIDTTLTESGFYQFYGTNSEGKTTLTLLDLRVDRPIFTYLERTTCEGMPFNYQGQLLDQTEVYRFEYTSSIGCDSIVLLDLLIGERTVTTLNETIAANQGIVIGQNVVNLEGSYEFIFQSATGCDSIVQLNLSIEGTPDSIVIDDADLAAEICEGTLNLNLCPPDLPFILGQNTFWQGGNFALTYPAPDGCVQAINLILTVAQNVERRIENICEGNTYVLNNKTYSTTGIYIDTLIGAGSNNCDSIIMLDLTVMPTKDTTINQTICWGVPFYINGQLITQSGEYLERLPTINGCDSIVTTILTVTGAPNPDPERLTLCAGESYADDMGNQVFVSGVYNFQFISPTGCDSVIRVDLLIPDTIRSQLDTFFCDGEVFEFENFAVTRSGNYRERFISSIGCDSIAQYRLTAIDCEISSVQDADTIICGGNTGEFSFMLIKGQAPFSYEWSSADGLRSGQGADLNLMEEVVEEGLPGGVYEVIVTDRNGQEAILEITIFRPEIITAEWVLPELANNTHLSCTGDSTAFLQINPSGGLPPFRYQWSSSILDTNRIEDLPAGAYTVTVTDDLNCPYIATQELIAPPELMVESTFENPNCENLAGGTISISEIKGGIPPYQFRLQGITEFSSETTINQLMEGTYTLNTMDANGCQIDTSFTLVAPEVLDLDYESETIIKLGDSYPISVMPSDTPQTIIWEELDGLSCYDCLDSEATPFETTIYTLTVTSRDDCATSIQIKVSVSKEREVYIPNVFSPNQDGLNDHFTIFGGVDIANIDLLQIYSRWGELLYESNNIPLNDTQKGWDGTHQGKEMNPGVFVWVARIQFIDGAIETYSGDLTLMK